MMYCFKNIILIIYFLQASVKCWTKPLDNDQDKRQISNGLTYQDDYDDDFYFNLQQKQPKLNDNFWKTIIMNDDGENGEGGNTLTVEHEKPMKFSCTKRELYICWMSRLLIRPSENILKNPKGFSMLANEMQKCANCWQEEINFRLMVPFASEKGQQIHPESTPKTYYDDDHDDETLTNDVNDNLMPNERNKRIAALLSSDQFRAPHHPYAFAPSYGTPHIKRVKPHMSSFYPSIGAGTMTDLSKFFNDFTQNVNFAEKAKFGINQQKLLEGDHPLNNVLNTDDKQMKSKTAEFLNAITSYRPSQKIRSLVSMNPYGYHGSKFLDPNYMWVGLGK